MEAIEEYALHKDHAMCLLKGRARLDRAAQLVGSAILRARKDNACRLLVNISKLEGFRSPTIAERYFIVREWAKLAEGRVKLAMVVQQHLIDPERFGITVAANAGLEANVSSVEAEMLDWLLSGIRDEL